MKRVRLSVRPALDRAPAFVAHLLDSPSVREARAIDWNRGGGAVSTHLYAVDGDAGGFFDRVEAAPDVDLLARATPTGPVSYALLTVRDESLAVFGEAAGALSRTGLVVQRPLVYREGSIQGHAVGEAAVLQATLEAMPDSVSVRVDEIGRFPSPGMDPAAALTDRQREAVTAALDLGYYETPRDCTQADVAAELGCAPNTAGEHLRKAEARLVRAGMDALARGR